MNEEKTGRATGDRGSFISPDLGGPSPYEEETSIKDKTNVEDLDDDDFEQERRAFQGDLYSLINREKELPPKELSEKIPEKSEGERPASKKLERKFSEEKIIDRGNLADLITLSKYLDSKESIRPFARAYKGSQDKVIDILERLRGLPEDISEEMRTERYREARDEILEIYEKTRTKEARRESVKNGLSKVWGGASRAVSKAKPFLKKNPRVVAGIFGAGLIYLGATQGWKALTYSVKKVPDAVEYVVDVFKEDDSGERIESSGKSLDDKVSAPVAKSAPTRSSSETRKVDSSSRGVKLPRKGIYEGVSEGKEIEYDFTYDEKKGRTELLIEDKGLGIKYLLADKDDSKTLSDYKHLSPDELTLDEIVIIDNNDRHKYFLRRGEIEKLEPGVSDRQFFVNMQTAFRQIYNYLGENPK